MADQPSPHRRFQFRLRTLMIGVTLLAIPCAYLHWRVRPEQERDAALRRIVELGGSPFFVKSHDRLYLIFLPATTKLEDRRAIRAALPGVEFLAFNPEDGRGFHFPEDALTWQWRQAAP
jgi:hypothetical protein